MFLKLQQETLGSLYLCHDLRELLRVPMRSLGYCGVGRGLSVLHWVWCNGRGPHLEFRWESQPSSPFLTLIPGSLQNWNRRVRPRLVLRNGTPLASRVVPGVTGHLSSCIWNLWGFPDDATGVSMPLRVVSSSTGLHSKRCSGIGFLSRVDGEIVCHARVSWHDPGGYLSNFFVRPAS